MPLLPADVRTLLADQLARVARWQLVGRLGISGDRVDGWVRHGRLDRTAQRGVYALPGAVLHPAQRHVELVLRGGTDAVAGPWSSCALAGLEGFPLDGSADLLVPRRSGVAVAGAAVVRLDVSSCDVVTVHGVNALAPAPAIVGLAAEVAEKRVRVAVDDARRRRMLAVPWLLRRAQAWLPHPGAAVVLDLDARGLLDPESEGERTMQDFLAGAGIPVEWAVSTVVPGRRLDAFERLLLIDYEYDGRDHHTLPTDREADAQRDREVRACGIEVFRFTRAMLGPSPDAATATAERLEAVRRGRAALLGVPWPLPLA